MDICVGTRSNNGADTGEQLIYIALPLQTLCINLPLFKAKRESEELCSTALSPRCVTHPRRAELGFLRERHGRTGSVDWLCTGDFTVSGNSIIA